LPAVGSRPQAPAKTTGTAPGSRPIEPGSSTAFPFNVKYRVRRVSRYIQGGSWLDFGCAEGGYTAELRLAGAAIVVGIDIDADLIESARRLHPEASFYLGEDDRLAFASGSFDGVFMNEVFEHVADEHRVLAEVHRVLKPGGRLILISPNRGFPFEGHGVHIGRWSSKRPIPFVPWLPRAVTSRWVTARNYWPQELRDKVASNGFCIVETGFVMPVFEGYPWVPASIVRGFRRHITFFDRCPGIRRAGVSNLVVALRE